MIEDGKTVKIHYTLIVDGEIIDGTEGRDPLEYIHGRQQLIPGLERRLAGLKAGEEVEVSVAPDDAYGVEDPKAYIEIAKSKMPEGEVEVGMLLHATGPDGRQMVVRVAEVKDASVILNFNHPLAGKQLLFKVTVVEIAEK